MKVKLISYTQPVEEIVTVKDLVELIAYVARVSNPSNQANNLTAPKLVKYLEEHKHWSPFEMVDLTFEIECTRDIGRQILRHRSFSFQEFSQRYADVNDLIEMFEISECRLQDTKNRQNSLETDDEQLAFWWESAQNQVANFTSDIYSKALDKGIAKELARKVLPEGLTKTRMYMKGSLRSWIHFIEVRADEATQKEHRVVAEAICERIEPLAPGILNHG